jgi:uncharacterized membrane protein YdjX (TVP38/TMEM64 family)
MIPPFPALGIAATSTLAASLPTISLDVLPILLQPLHILQSIDISQILDHSTIPDPLSFVSTLLLVTGSDMIPFLPCQPLAISLGATYGIWAYPICVVGQTLAGILSFQTSRTASDSQKVQDLINNLGQEAQSKFQEFKELGQTEDESKVLLTLIGLRLAPMFPFSATNYLLGGGTSVTWKPFVIATIFGCLLSNLLSVSVGMGGSELLFPTTLPSNGV